MNNKNKNESNAKYLRHGGYSLLICAAVAAAVVIINLVCSLIPDNLAVIDTSETGVFTLTEGTEEIVRAADEDITIYLVAQTGNENLAISQLLDRYGALSSHISIKKIDPVLYPTFTADYTTLALNENSIIVESEKRFKVIDYSSIYQTVTSSDGTTAEEHFFGETEITSAIDYVLSDSVPTIYFLTGHDESSFDEVMLYALSTDNYSVETLNILTSGSIPVDASCVVCYMPASELATAELTAIEAYLRGGGKFILLTDYLVPLTENYISLTSSYGMNYVPGLVVEGNANYYIDQPYTLVPTLETNEITQKAYASVGGQFAVIMPQSHGITLSTTEGITHTVLMKTSSSAYTKLNISEDNPISVKAEGDAVGPFAVGAMAQNAFGGELVWFSSVFLPDSNLDAYAGGGNSAYLLTLFADLCGKEDSVAIASKSLATPALLIESSTATLWSVVFCGIIPAAAIVGGLIIWIRRRKR